MIEWLAETTLELTVLMLLVLALRRPVAHSFGAGWAYALWLLPALRMVMPPIDLGSHAIMLPEEASGSIEPVMVLVKDAQQSAAWQWEMPLLLLWLAGALLFALFQAVSYVRFTRRLGIGSAHQADLIQKIGVIESPEVEGPLAIGLLDKWIVVPTDFTTRYSADEQRLALQHERVHHQREDILCNFAALVVLALNWFNPVAHIAFRAFRSDQELSCDAAVAARAPADDRIDYAQALIKSASRPGLVAVCPLNRADQLKRRLKMIKEHRTSKCRTLGGAVSLVTLLAGGLAFSSAGLAQSSNEKAAEGPDKKVERRLVIIEDKASSGPPGEVRRFEHFRGEPGKHAMHLQCSDAEKFETDVSDGKDKMKFMICAKGGEGDMVQHLERAVARLQSDNEVSPERRGKVIAALQAEIARRKAAQ